MKVSEILEIEKSNSNSINLFREGLFWRCYEVSGWNFIKNIREYRVFKKFIKTVNQDIIYLGFPNNIIEEILKEAEKKNYSVIKSKTKISITGILQEKGFLKWKESISLLKPKRKTENSGKKGYYQIIKKIMGFPIINKTPVEAFNFLAEIQKELKTFNHAE